MAIFGVICLIVLVGAAVLIYLQKTGIVGDRDKDLIPGVIEDTIEETQKRVKAVKKEVKEAKVAVKKAAKEVGDVTKAIAGKKTTTKRKKKVSKKQNLFLNSYPKMLQNDKKLKK